MAQKLGKRQNPLTNSNSNANSNSNSNSDSVNSVNGLNGYNGYNGAGQLNWWWSPAGIATRYAVVAVLFAAVILFFLGGYLNAKKRMRKGLPLRRWNGWMVRRPGPTWNPPRGNVVYAQYGDPNNQYMMEGYPPPPPAYHNSEAPPPTYQPPPGASKAMADQNFRETTRAGEGSGSANAGE